MTVGPLPRWCFCPLTVICASIDFSRLHIRSHAKSLDGKGNRLSPETTIVLRLARTRRMRRSNRLFWLALTLGRHNVELSEH